MIKQIYPGLEEINDKEILQWILTAFLKDSLDFLGSDPNARKTKRIEWIHSWIQINLPYFLGKYKAEINQINDLQKEIKIWKKLES